MACRAADFTYTSNRERQHFAEVTPCLGEICATCHLSDTRCTKSLPACALRKSERVRGGGTVREGSERQTRGH